MRGATIELNKLHPLRYGLSVIMDGELSISGSSSSCVMIITFINALAFVYEISLSKKELIDHYEK